MESPTESVCKEHIFSNIFNKNSKTIHNYVYYKCGDQDKAADIVQEAFVKLWQNCAKVPAEKAISFLYTVANNLFLNDIAHQKVRLTYQNTKIGQVEHEDPEFAMEGDEYMKKLENAIANLSEAQREAFLLNRIDGKKYKEIAEILGISIKAVEKRISGALESLRQTIGNI